MTCSSNSVNLYKHGNISGGKERPDLVDFIAVRWYFIVIQHFIYYLLMSQEHEWDASNISPFIVNVNNRVRVKSVYFIVLLRSGIGEPFESIKQLQPRLILLAGQMKYYYLLDFTN